MIILLSDPPTARPDAGRLVTFAPAMVPVFARISQGMQIGAEMEVKLEREPGVYLRRLSAEEVHVRRIGEPLPTEYTPPKVELAKAFDRVVVINLDRRPDRMVRMMGELERCGWPFKMPERVRAIDGGLIPCPNGWSSGGGAYGCRQSHMRIFEDALMDGVNNLLVLEDDATFAPDFGERVDQFMERVPNDWDQLMLGGQYCSGSTKTRVANGVVRAVNCQRTHAYAIRRRMMKQMYGKWASAYGHIDHIMGPFQRAFAVYAPDPFLVGQSEGKSDISGANNAVKFWIDPDPGQPVYWLIATLQVMDSVRGRGFHSGNDRNEIGACRGLDPVVNAKSRKDAVRLLRDWINMIEWEGRARTPACRCCIWHPRLTRDLVKEAAGERLQIINGEEAEELADKVTF